MTTAYPSKANWIARPWATVFLRYGLALVSVAVAQGLSHTFLYFHLPQPLAVFALCAIAITFRYAGTMPGILAALLSALLRSYVFEPQTTTVSRLLYDFGFLIFAVLMIRFTRERKGLESGVAERTAELTRANEGLKLEIEDRKRVEEALTASEHEQHRIAEQLERERARLVEAQEVGKIGSWEAELPSLNVVWSEQTHRIFETDPSRFGPTREKFRGFIHPDDRAKVDTAFKMSLGKSSPHTVEYRIVMPDGRLKFIEERWRAFFDKQGKPVRVAGTCRDTTERVRAEEERRHLSGKLLRSRDEERRRIARDLHDDLGQDLFAALLALAQLSRGIPNERKQKLLSETREIIHACAEKVRTLAHLLRPPELERLGLKTAIVVYVDGFRERTRTQIDIEIPAGLPKLPQPIETALFKMTQECLLNIQRHSKSSEAQIRIESTPGEITLEVRDEGVGMQPASSGVAEGSQPRLGVGLTGMSERIEELGGRLEITSGSWGTSVKATLPLVLSQLESES